MQCGRAALKAPRQKGSSPNGGGEPTLDERAGDLIHFMHTTTSLLCTRPVVLLLLFRCTAVVVRSLPVELPPSPLAGDGASAPIQACVDGSPHRQNKQKK